MDKSKSDLKLSAERYFVSLTSVKTEKSSYTLIKWTTKYMKLQTVIIDNKEKLIFPQIIKYNGKESRYKMIKIRWRYDTVE